MQKAAWIKHGNKRPHRSRAAKEALARRETCGRKSGGDSGTTVGNNRKVTRAIVNAAKALRVYGLQHTPRGAGAEAGKGKLYTPRAPERRVAARAAATPVERLAAPRS
ncbi:unnamed protein product [Rangifer tarandus platyrhynchus]|uniref:Uncharacterized protein n=1 Tax=Rangifer tarandus platyrhynchus TaxID=3082113 RepID=A0ABN8XIM4_RANTA|nr:unnamed protein product [Rangifer tarandus platyrhynchus]